MIIIRLKGQNVVSLSHQVRKIFQEDGLPITAQAQGYCNDTGIIFCITSEDNQEIIAICNYPFSSIHSTKLVPCDSEARTTIESYLQTYSYNQNSYTDKNGIIFCPKSGELFVKLLPYVAEDYDLSAKNDEQINEQRLVLIEKMTKLDKGDIPLTSSAEVLLPNIQFWLSQLCKQNGIQKLDAYLTPSKSLILRIESKGTKDSNEWALQDLGDFLKNYNIAFQSEPTFSYRSTNSSCGSWLPVTKTEIEFLGVQIREPIVLMTKLAQICSVDMPALPRLDAITAAAGKPYVPAKHIRCGI